MKPAEFDEARLALIGAENLLTALGAQVERDVDDEKTATELVLALDAVRVVLGHADELYERAIVDAMGESKVVPIKAEA